MHQIHIEHLLCGKHVLGLRVADGENMAPGFKEPLADGFFLVLSLNSFLGCVSFPLFFLRSCIFLIKYNVRVFR